ncbi:polyadenylate-binding protein-interacting protein 11 [Citrus sinensis]|uniref:Polyadenylate-binding protein-interacting protein 11 n=1 Tax=Citrus sinensis TaxID=2711 RepID=A0ACB8M3X1_CITSI|nr:polyadenylate-binding protein-interacting protein 11 [Citrus sinensis]
MAVAENAGAKIDSSNQNLDDTVVSSDSNDVQNSNDHSKERSGNGNANIQIQNGQTKPGAGAGGGFVNVNASDNHMERKMGESFKDCEMRDLVDMLSKLNPMAAEFVPPSLANGQIFNFNPAFFGPNGFGYTNNFIMHTDGTANTNGHTTTRRKRNGYSQGKRRMNCRTSNAQQDEVIRRTVYVSDIDQQVTEEQLATLFLTCGQVVDCRICGDPNSVLRFAFVEFTDEEGARAALSLAGTMLGFYPVRVLPSKTAIAPVNPTFLPRKFRIYLMKKIWRLEVTQGDIKLFFESVCGEVQRLRLLGDYQHSTRIAFVEFAMLKFTGDRLWLSVADANSELGKGWEEIEYRNPKAIRHRASKAESAIAALNCSGAVLGSLPIRVSPSKTPVRPRAPRPPLH